MDQFFNSRINRPTCFDPPDCSLDSDDGKRHAETIRFFEPPRYNNAAGRLKQFLERLLTQEHGNSYFVTLMRTAYSDAEISGTLDADTWRKLSELLIGLNPLVNEIEDGLKTHRTEDFALYSDMFPILRRVFTPADLNQALNNYASEINRTMKDLSHAAKDLPPEGVVAKDELERLYQSVVELFNEVNQSDLRAELKQWILRLLDKILQAINQFQISGAKGLKKALVELVGELVVETGRTSELMSKPELVVKIRRVCDDIRTAVMTAQQIQTTAELLTVFWNTLPSIL